MVAANDVVRARGEERGDGGEKEAGERESGGAEGVKRKRNQVSKRIRQRSGKDEKKKSKKQKTKKRTSLWDR